MQHFEDPSENSSVCVVLSVITHEGVFLCPRSIFRMFSADRKRVETALENCNLPSGRVRHQITTALLFFSVAVSLYFLFSLNLLAFVYLLLTLISKLFHHLHPSISLSPRRSAHSLFSCNSSRVLCPFVLESYFLDVCMTSHSELI